MELNDIINEGLEEYELSRCQEIINYIMEKIYTGKYETNKDKKIIKDIFKYYKYDDIMYCIREYNGNKTHN